MAIFADISKIVTTFIKTSLEIQKVLKELEIMYRNTIYISVFLDIAKCTDFR